MIIFDRVLCSELPLIKEIRVDYAIFKNMIFDKNYINIPNILSFYRLITFPLVMYLALTLKETTYVILLVINLITDALDGIIARAFNLQTEFGSRLDAYADIGMYITAIVGVLMFKLDDIVPHLTIFAIFILTFLLPKIISFIRFKRFPSFHLYSSKAGGYMQGIFFFIWFVFGFNAVIFYVVILFGIMTFIEQSFIAIISTELKSNVKGLYWIIKE